MKRIDLAESYREAVSSKVRLSLVNLYLHGFTDPHIAEYDTLTSEDNWNEYADIVLANPPFMSPKGGIKPHKRFSIQAKRSEVLFVDYISEHLTPNGRAAVIVPEGIIFQSQNAYKQLREMLVKNYLYAVVSLPAGVFQPYSGVKTSILLMDKALAKRCNSLLFVKVENDGFDLGAQRRKIDKDNLPESIATLQDFHQSCLTGEDFNADLYSNVLKVEKEKIGENGEWNLSGDRYRENAELRVGNYELVELGEIAEILNGYAFKSKEYSETGIRVLRITNVQKGKIVDDNPKFYPIEKQTEIEKYLLHEKDLLLSLTGNVGRVGVVPEKILPAGLNQRVACLRVKKQINSTFLFYLLNQDYFEEQCINSSDGIAQKNLSTVWLSSYQFLLPPLNIQQEIVAEIEGYQKIIDGARSVVDNYKPQIQISPDWEMVKLGEVLSLRGGYAFKSSDFTKTGIQVIKMGNVKQQYFDVENKPSFLPKEFKRKYKDYVLTEGDILISMTGTVGKTDYGNVCIIDHEGEFLLNQRVGKFQFRSENICDKKYIYHVANQDIFRDAIFRNSSGGVRQANISSKQIESINIPLPNIETQTQIVAQIEKEQSLVNANKELIILFEQKIKDKIASVWGE